jgi:hypothetical protein
MFKRNRKSSQPVIAYTRTDWKHDVVAVEFADGVRASREQYGYWMNMSWDTTVLPMPHYAVLLALQ